MRFRHVNAYPAPPDRGPGDATNVVITQSQARDGAPAAARKLVGNAVQIVQRESWTTTDHADFAMEIPGTPGHLRGTITLADTGDGGCEEVFAGEAKVNVPLLGGKLEGFVADILPRAPRREGEVGVTWLERVRPRQLIPCAGSGSPSAGRTSP